MGQFLLILTLFANLILVRHGESLHNIEDTYNSDPSNPHYHISALTQKGEAQTDELAFKLLCEGFNNENIAVVYVSPLPRTRQTAQILSQCGVFSSDKIVIDPRLSEIKMGDLEGEKILHHWKPEYAEKYHTETDKEVDQRVSLFYHDLLKNPVQGNIMVITHGQIAKKLARLDSQEIKKLGTGQFIVLPL